MAFYRGQKVVVVNMPKNLFLHEGEIAPEQNTIYTIRDITKWGVNFYELRNPIVMTIFGEMERVIDFKHIRPLVERKTDISVFKEMLKTKEKELVT